MRAFSSGNSCRSRRGGAHRRGDEKSEIDPGEVALLDEGDGRDLPVRAFDLLHDRTPDPAHGNAAPLKRGRGRPDVGLGDATARACALQ